MIVGIQWLVSYLLRRNLVYVCVLILCDLCAWRLLELCCQIRRKLTTESWPCSSSHQTHAQKRKILPPIINKITPKKLGVKNNPGRNINLKEKTVQMTNRPVLVDYFTGSSLHRQMAARMSPKRRGLNTQFWWIL